jgi:ABC-type multidrug transport system fused ATPase/permease subunit
MTVEEKKDGAVKGMYYWRYLSSGGPPVITIPLLLLSFILMQSAQTISQWWLVFWTSDTSYLRFSMGTYMGVYFATGVASALFSFTRIITTGFMGVRASRKLHGDLFKAVIAAPMSFFDTTPVGRLISRFTKDMDAVDVTLPSSLGMFAMMVWGIIFSLGAIIFAVPWFAVAILPIGYIYQSWMVYFRNTARECKRYDNIRRSPIYAHFSESLGGLATIRAYGLTTIFSATNEARVGDSVRAYYNLKVCDRWLAIRLEALGNMVVLATALLCVGTITLTSRTDGSASGLSGFALTFAMSLTGLMNFGVRMAADAEQQMTAVERVVEYVDDTPSEPYEAPPGSTPPPPSWPASGTLAFEKYHMRYRPDTPLVLHGVSFSIRAGERVGVVGRTGSGKSSVMAALFRLVTRDCKQGVVRLDGLDTDGVALSRLRPSLAIIPQDPTVFSGTLRANLDPSEVLGPASPASDAALWAALDKVNLKAWAERLDKRLDAPISEFGENLSVGQKQLVCLCRVLIRASKITVLALDEASASLDHVSDAALQKVIQENFLHATHFIVAHRLHSIIGCDRILV